MVKTALAFLLGQLAVFSKLGREVRVGFLLVGIAGVGVSGGVGSTGVAGVVFIVVGVFIFVGVGSGGVASVGALALVIGALGLWSTQSFPGHFGAVFPITRIDGLSKDAEFREGVGFTDAGNFILDSGREPTVQLSG